MSNQRRPYILAETNWKSIRDTQFDIAILPWGATEAHNYHMPYATDNYQVDHVAYRSAEMAWDNGAKVIVLPTIPYGVNTGQLDIPFCMNMNPSTQLAILKDICEVLTRHGIEKLVVLNGHGGNNFISMIRELAGLYPDLFISTINWFKAAAKDDIFEKPGDHADEMETSVMMHLHPELLLPLSEAGNGETKRYQPIGFQEGWAWAQRPWTMVTNDTGSGDPSLSTAEKGSIFLDRCIHQIASFFIETAGRPVASLIK